MALLVPRIPQFNYVTGNALTTAPTAAYGTSITPGASNAYGSYTEILSDANLTKDCYGILLCFSSGSTSAEARDTLVTIGTDTSGGTSYSDFITHLLASCAISHVAAGHQGIWYYFPVRIPAGTAIAAKASVNHATARTIRVACWLFGAPQTMEGLIYGHGVETIGAVTASSKGTDVTPGNAAEGSWTSLGSTTKACFSWQYGIGINNGTMAAAYHTADLSYGNGTNQIMIDQDMAWATTTTEQASKQLRPAMPCNVPIGGTIYGRMSCNGAPVTGISMAAYGVY